MNPFRNPVYNNPIFIAVMVLMAICCGAITHVCSVVFALATGARLNDFTTGTFGAVWFAVLVLLLGSYGSRKRG